MGTVSARVVRVAKPPGTLCGNMIFFTLEEGPIVYLDFQKPDQASSALLVVQPLLASESIEDTNKALVRLTEQPGYNTSGSFPRIPLWLTEEE